MKASYVPYVHADSIQRIDETLAAKDEQFEEVSSIPSRDRLTFTNGFYVKCSCVFVDLRDSSKLPDRYKRPTLARIYRSYISECVAVLSGEKLAAEVNIHGDAVWAVFDTPNKADINEVFGTVARLNSLKKTLNCRYKRYGLDPISVGIGADWGRALMIKAGYKGSTINEVVWMGEVVNQASNLSGRGAKDGNATILVSDDFRFNLNEHNQSLLRRNAREKCYEGDVVNSSMEEWWKTNCS